MMKTMKEAIELAIKGGWCDVRDLDSQVTVAFCDPLFWSSLGKALEWSPTCCSWCGTTTHQKEFMGYGNGYRDGDCDCPMKFTKSIPTWQFHWHSFIDHLASGHDAESFFVELLNNYKPE